MSFWIGGKNALLRYISSDVGELREPSIPPASSFILHFIGGLAFSRPHYPTPAPHFCFYLRGWKASNAMSNVPWEDTLVVADILKEPLEEIQWYWVDRFRANSLNLISGQRDGGKSTLLMYLAHKTLCGGTWPLLPDEPIKTGSVIYMATEDVMSEDARPKFEALRLDTGRGPLDDNKFLTITKVVRSFESGAEPIDQAFRDWKQHKKKLENLISEIGNVRLILLDPIISFGGDVKGNDEKSTRDYLEMLLSFAQENKVTIIGTRHVNKDEKQSAEQRTMGSSSWQDVPRAVWMLAKHPDDAHLTDPQKIRRTLTLSKCNRAVYPTNLQFKLRSVSIFKGGKDDRGLPVCDFDSKPLKMTANEVFDIDARKRKAESLSKAHDWLKDVLTDGPRTVIDLKKMAKNIHAWGTVEKASQKLGIISNELPRVSGTRTGNIWRLP